MIRQYLGALLVLAGGVALAVMIIAAGPVPDAKPVNPKIPVVQAAPAAPRWVQMTVDAHGEVLPKTASDLVSEVAGRVVAVSPSMVSGGFFNAGDVLVEIERVDYEVSLERARARLASAKSELENAERAFRRQEDLAITQSVSESVRDDAHNRLSIARAALREATAVQVRAQRDLQRTWMKAPYDGRVRTERVDVGQFVNRGESIAKLYSIDYAEVRLPVRDVDLAFLPLSLARASDNAPAPKVILRAEFAGAEHAWEAQVVRTEGELDPRTRMVNIIAQVASPYDPVGNSPPLTVGLFVRAEIFGVWLENVVIVPRTALQEGDRLYVVAEDSRLSFRNVNVLRLTGDAAYIQGGVQPGELICLSTLANAIEGQVVRPIAVAAS